MTSESESRVIYSPGRTAPGASRLGGKLIEATRMRARATQLEIWQEVLVPGQCRLKFEPTTGRMTAIRAELPEADVTELVNVGSNIIRSRPDGDVQWTLQGLTSPRKEGMPYRVQLENETGVQTSIALSELMAAPDVNNRSWVIPVPTD